MRAFIGRLAHRLFPGLARSLVNGRILALSHGQLRASAATGPVDAAGEPIPWYTYPAIEYLSQFDWRERSVFEFGAGNSSLFWARRAARVCTVENDPAWHAGLAAAAPGNLKVFLCPEKNAYLACLTEQALPFDLIAIDGRWRQSCARLARDRLTEGGLIVLDNAERYPQTARELRAAGFFQIDFSGFGPLNSYTWTTSVFLRGDGRLQQGLTHPRPIGGVPDDEPEDA